MTPSLIGTLILIVAVLVMVLVISMLNRSTLAEDVSRLDNIESSCGDLLKGIEGLSEASNRREEELSERLEALEAIIGRIDRNTQKGIGKERGRRKAIRALADHYKALVKDASQQIVGIAHADCAEDAEFLNGLLREAARPKSVLNVLYEPVTGCHVGAGTLALFFLGDENVRSRD